MMRTGASPFSSSAMVSVPTPSASGKMKPPMPMIKPPIAGHHIQCIGSFWKASSDA
jgi:hypothetical protein